MFQRTLSLEHNLARKSLFLLGPRQTGKSTYLRTLYPNAKYYDLLASDTFRQLSFQPETIRNRLKGDESIIVIDEIQKLPGILDEVHLLIEMNKDLRFVLTGSSARKLKKNGINLLAGRASTQYLFPLVYPETGSLFLDKRLRIGSLPSVLTSPDPYSDLKDYVGTYLQEEIRAESLTRSIESFSRFLTVAGLCNTQQVNFTKIGNDAQVPARTVREFFEVLQDTLIARMLPPFQKLKERKPVAVSKVYFFDIGVAHALQGIKEVYPNTAQHGTAIEHLIYLELLAFLAYKKIDEPITFFRTTSQMEVDFLIGDHTAIEVKATGRVSKSDCRGLIALGEETTLERSIIISNDNEFSKLSNGIEVFPLEEFLKALWAGGILKY